MALADDLERAAARPRPRTAQVAAVLAAEPARRAARYLVALGEDDDRSWLVLDARARPGRRARRQSARSPRSSSSASSPASSRAAAQLEELRAQLAQVRLTEQPPGIEEAEEAALALERAIGAPPVVASPAYLDDGRRRDARARGRARRPRLAVRERARAASGTVEAFVAEVEGRHAGCRCARVCHGRRWLSASRSAAIRRICSAGCASSPSSRPSRCRRRSASSSRR